MPDTKQSNTPSWKPSCSLEAIKTRAEVYALVRDFFYERQSSAAFTTAVFVVCLDHISNLISN